MATAQPQLETHSLPASGSLKSATFLGLLATQFLSAVNDNVFRWLAVPIGKYYAGQDNAATVLSAGLACFVLPYILLAGPAGYLADRFSKRSVIVACKFAEIAILALGLAAISSGSVYFLFAIVALLGCQAALFGPAEMASLPEMLHPTKLSTANGLMGMVTVAAIVLGSLLGNYLFHWTGPDGRTQLWISGLVLIGTAIAGTATSFLIRRAPAANPDAKLPWNPLGHALHDLAVLARNRGLATAAVGSAFFWSLASLAQLNVDSYGILELGLEQHEIGPLLAVMALGVGFGSLLAGWLSAGRIELGIVPCGAAGIAVGALGLAATGDSYAATLVGLFCMGAGAGMFDVPLQTYLQSRSPITSRGAVLAATNFLTFSGSLACAGIFWFLREPLGCSPRQIFLLSGLTVLPIIALAFKLVPAQVIKLTVSLATRFLYRVRVIDAQHVPVNEGALLVANHVSWVDAVLMCLNSERRIRMIGYADYFESWPMNWIARQMGVIPIKPGAGRRSILESLNTARDAVAAGELVCIFAEGAITRDGAIGPFKPGLLAVVRGTGAKVIPVYLDGLWGSIFSYRGGTSFLKWPRRWPLPVAIHYGKPLAAPQNADEVREAVIRLSRESQNPTSGGEAVVTPSTLPMPTLISSRNRIAAFAPSEV